MASKVVYCYELNKSFPSIAEASRETGASVTGISACCHEKQRSAGGYRWAFVTIAGSTIKDTSKPKAKKQVYCIDTCKIYESAAEASRKTGVSASGISACCRGVQKTAGGYRWKYLG